MCGCCKTKQNKKLLVLLGTAGTTRSYPWLWWCGPLGPLSAKWCLCFIICYLGLSQLSFQGAYLLNSWLQSLFTIILEPKKIKSVIVPAFPSSICHEVMGPDVMILAFECWVLSQLLYSPVSLSSWGSLVPLHVLSLDRMHTWGCWYFSQQSWFQLVIHPAWNFACCNLHRR